MEVKTRKIKKILIIDDNKIDSLLTKKILNKYFELEEISEIHYPDLAFKHLEETNKSEMPDLILLDFIMPNINGNDFIKKYNNSPSIFKENTFFYILTSAYYTSSTHETITEISPNQIFSKPFDYKSFNSQLKLNNLSITIKNISNL